MSYTHAHWPSLNNLQTRSSIPVPRSEILDLSNPNAPSLNAHVRRGLDDIASSTLAHIAVVNTSTPMSTLERGETPCHLVVTGPSDTVALAQVRLLVMLDELSGLHAELIDIDCKLHPMVAGRKRLRVQHIQEQTATNIYFPYPLRGMVGGPAAPNPNAKNGIWITGEFFGVQRAKEMLFQVARNKVSGLLQSFSVFIGFRHIHPELHFLYHSRYCVAVLRSLESLNLWEKS